jgi:hypothetical protein
VDVDEGIDVWQGDFVIRGHVEPGKKDYCIGFEVE